MVIKDQSRTAPPPAPDPQVTVLITAHNEAESIQACLHAILGQDYPMERVELLLVDDRSTDGTAARALELGIPTLRVIRIDAPPDGLTTRQAALDLGLREARGEIVMIADAGGRVPREWMRELTGHMSYRDAAVTGPVIFAGRPRWLARFQSLDALVTFNLCAWSQRHRIPAGVFAANLVLRRQAYLDIGGFERIGFATAPDLALGRALAQAGWSIRYLTAPAVQNLCSRRLGELISRRRRRTRSQATVIVLIFLAMVLSNWFLLGAAIGWGGIWVSLLFLRYLAGVTAITFAIGKYGPDRLQSLWLFEPLLTLVLTFVYLSLLVSPSWRWGGIHYDRRGQPEGAADRPAA